MKRLLIYAAVAIVTIAAVSCDENFEVIEDSGMTAGTPSPVESITADSLPGQIVLHWEVPVDSNYYLLKINYYDYLAETEVYKVASVYEDSLLIDETRAKFGEYEFTFQTFNRNNEASAATTIKAKSGIAPATETITTTKIALTADQLSTNNQEPSEGPIANLLDGDIYSFFHTRWSSPQIPMPQYIQIDLNEPIDDFQFYFVNRAWSQVGAEIVEVQVSNDGETWETVQTISAGLPSAGYADYTSQIFRMDHTFTHFRYNVVQTYGSRNYFNMAEFSLYDVTIDTYDPEL
ncbi:discoidin domain-containing protein [Mangrovibacterium lignilyticum]|uniref:discoidin domain-containing protein n=1 Tax=Mangrovibacterium lignilyticum TaxID=2668052 RepID=UPI0013D5513C|nr:discoidin domain-containing protein [Mangrovibacterium lignilyticum]